MSWGERGNCIGAGSVSDDSGDSVDVAVRYPEVYAGSIVLSPGADSHLSEVLIGQ